MNDLTNIFIFLFIIYEFYRCLLFRFIFKFTYPDLPSPNAPVFVFVTGVAPGNIGNEICLQLVQQGYFVFAGVHSAEYIPVLTAQIGSGLRSPVQNQVEMPSLKKLWDELNQYQWTLSFVLIMLIDFIIGWLNYFILNIPFMKQTTRTGLLIPIQVDISSESSLEQAQQVMQSHFSQFQQFSFSGIIHCAALVEYGPLLTFPKSSAEEMLRINLLGWLFLIQRILPQLRSEGRPTFQQESFCPRLIVLSSTVAEISFPCAGLYAACKHAIEAMSYTLFLEYKRLGKPLTISMIRPSPIQSPLWQKLTQKLISSVLRQRNEDAKSLTLQTIESFQNMPSGLFMNSWWPAQSVLHALQSPYPRRHYSVGWLAWGLLMLRSLLPEFLLDDVLVKKGSGGSVLL